jgi:membrane carboxypeptidase/penicillin-binding protein
VGARTLNAEQYYTSALINSVKAALKENDLVIVRAVAEAKGLTDDGETRNDAMAKDLPTDLPLVRLEQEPELQSALVSIDPQRQYLVAMVGGYDFDANEFNRAFQACRQPGSSFKPIVYATAFEKLGWTQGTVLVDSPIVYDDPENQNRWKPANYDEDFKGEVLVRTALVNSMNLPAIKTFIEIARKLGAKNEKVGIEAFADFIRTLGISNHADTNEDGVPDSPVNHNYSTALGLDVPVPARARERVRDHQPPRREEADLLRAEDRRPLRPHHRRPHRVGRPVGLAARPRGGRLRAPPRAR